MVADAEVFIHARGWHSMKGIHVSLCAAAWTIVVTTVTGTVLAADPALQSAPVIIDVLEAGIYCSGSSRDDELGPKFYSRVERDCLGKRMCRASPLDVATEAELSGAMCTRFFVQFTCTGSEPTELESLTLRDVLTPSCS
jgi:hypothetical protein